VVTLAASSHVALHVNPFRIMGVQLGSRHEVCGEMHHVPCHDQV
jgi:hypothetical protein